MISSKNVEKIIRDGKPNVKTNNQLDKLIIGGSYSIMNESKSLSPEFSISILLVRHKVAVSGIAAVIILALGFLLFRPETQNNIEPPEVIKVIETPSEMLTLRSLKLAYYNGGIEAVEAQCDNAIERLRPKPEKITIEELYAEINGT